MPPPLQNDWPPLDDETIDCDIIRSANSLHGGAVVAIRSDCSDSTSDNEIGVDSDFRMGFSNINQTSLEAPSEDQILSDVQTEGRTLSDMMDYELDFSTDLLSCAKSQNNRIRLESIHALRPPNFEAPTLSPAAPNHKDKREKRDDDEIDSETKYSLVDHETSGHRVVSVDRELPLPPTTSHCSETLHRLSFQQPSHSISEVLPIQPLNQSLDAVFDVLRRHTVRQQQPFRSEDSGAVDFSERRVRDQPRREEPVTENRVIKPIATGVQTGSGVQRGPTGSGVQTEPSPVKYRTLLDPSEFPLLDEVKERPTPKRMRIFTDGPISKTSETPEIIGTPEIVGTPRKFGAPERFMTPEKTVTTKVERSETEKQEVSCTRDREHKVVVKKILTPPIVIQKKPNRSDDVSRNAPEPRQPVEAFETIQHILSRECYRPSFQGVSRTHNYNSSKSQYSTQTGSKLDPCYHDDCDVELSGDVRGNRKHRDSLFLLAERLSNRSDCQSVDWVGFGIERSDLHHHDEYDPFHSPVHATTVEEESEMLKVRTQNVRTTSLLRKAVTQQQQAPPPPPVSSQEPLSHQWRKNNRDDLTYQRRQSSLSHIKSSHVMSSQDRRNSKRISDRGISELKSYGSSTEEIQRSKIEWIDLIEWNTSNDVSSAEINSRNDVTTSYEKLKVDEKCQDNECLFGKDQIPLCDEIDYPPLIKRSAVISPPLSGRPLRHVRSSHQRLHVQYTPTKYESSEILRAQWRAGVQFGENAIQDLYLRSSQNDDHREGLLPVIRPTFHHSLISPSSLMEQSSPLKEIRSRGISRETQIEQYPWLDNTVVGISNQIVNPIETSHSFNLFPYYGEEAPKRLSLFSRLSSSEIPQNVLSHTEPKELKFIDEDDDHRMFMDDCPIPDSDSYFSFLDAESPLSGCQFYCASPLSQRLEESDCWHDDVLRMTRQT